MLFRILSATIVVCVLTNHASASYIAFTQGSSAGFNILGDSYTGTLDASGTIGYAGYVDGMASAHADIGSGVIHMYSESISTGGTILGVSLTASVLEHYLLSGPDGQSARITAHLDFDALTNQHGTSVNVTGVGGRIASNHRASDGIADVFGTTYAADDETTGIAFGENEHLHAGEMAYTFDVSSGGTFKLAFSVFIHQTLTTGSQFTDMSNSATAWFEVPEGFVLTSQDGFGAPTPTTNAVPEPGTFALFGIGLVGLCGFRRRRKEPATPMA